ncbi:MAG: thiamine phosphate synthase [Chloroflexi bacterium]|nr:thiamine phosphate synthase [Chloroflexota bacterium]
MAAALPDKILCVVTDRTIFDTGGAPPEPRLIDAVRGAVSGGANMVQLRERGLAGRDLLSLALELRRITQDRALFVVNERVDIAIAAGADGVQLGEQSMSVSAAKYVCGDHLLIGRSVHDMYGAQDAERDGADFLIAGTIFASKSHPGMGSAGTALISEISGSVSTPTLGIGGITASNAAGVIAAGAAGIAVIGAMLDTSNSREAAEALAAEIGLSVAPVGDRTNR